MNLLTQQGWRWFSQALTQHNTFSAYFQPLIQFLVPQWSTDAYRAEVVAIRDEIADELAATYTLVLAPQIGLLDRQWPSFQAGQFIELMVEKDGRRTQRCFSISSAPRYYDETGLLELTIRIQQEGRITPWIRQQLKVGSLVNISAAQGQFVLPNRLTHTTNHKGSISPQAEKLLFIAGGSGITPFRSMLQQIKSSPSSLDIQLLYYSRDDQHVLFQQELQQLEAEVEGLKITFVNSEQEGFICQQHLQNFCPDFQHRSAYICGPSPMIQQARQLLTELDVVKENIHFEFFGSAPIDIAHSGQGAIQFQSSDKTVISTKAEAATLLEYAENAGINPVSGCRIGVCHQCICKKKSGIVFNTRTQEYSDSGSEEIQLCISVAQGDVVLDL